MNYLHRIVLNGGADWLEYRNGSGDTVEILDINVGSERRKGVGRLMVNTLLRRLKDEDFVWAITRINNCIAQEFYEELGFRVVGVLRNFYRRDDQTRVDAIMYGRKVLLT